MLYMKLKSLVLRYTAVSVTCVLSICMGLLTASQEWSLLHCKVDNSCPNVLLGGMKSLCACCLAVNLSVKQQAWDLYVVAITI